LKPLGDLGQIVPLNYDLRSEEQLIESIRHSDVVVNLIGRDYETKNFTFNQVHVDGSKRIAKICKDLNVSKLVHVSSLNADENSASGFLKSKALGEKEVLAEFPEAIIVRPGWMFGYEDRFWNRLGWWVKFSPIPTPMYNSGKTRMRPVYVNDVAEAIAKLVYSEQVGGVVELYGPREYTFKGLMEFFFDVTKRKRSLVLDYPKSIIKFIATVHDKITAVPIITPDEVERYHINDTPSNNDSVMTFKDLDIKPKTCEETVSRFVKLHQSHEFVSSPIDQKFKDYSVENSKYV